ncbi:c-type cytochrome [Desulfuromonas versatilis]|uniref:C-type cytochrome n=1 Tax=Desulfuromonas versatilis TaxID=2802975 RepID=A0ABN6E138_9BACT|nr:selenite/tellurite reduction operon c-type cytochrome lipoprotein ExtS [Desulfuromonas versatilis]BCR06080.1 c-type cytochrome [Desulfuromonas versatilis]
MGVRSAVLAILLLLAGALSAAAAAPEGCLECHPAHHVERGGCVDCHRGNPGTRRMAIAHHGMIGGEFAHFNLPDSPLVEQGRRLLESYACRRCHAAGGKGNRLASDLDRALRVRTAAEIAQALREPALFMPDFRFPPEQIAALVNALYAEGLSMFFTEREVPLVVHFAAQERGQDHAFTRACGSCHQLLTAGQGALGSGTSGPNLSGLLSGFYPPNFGEQGLPWSAERVEKWLKNPREIRRFTAMRPIRLEDEDLAQVAKSLGDSGPPAGSGGAGDSLLAETR